jgi:hypothetical protein
MMKIRWPSDLKKLRDTIEKSSPLKDVFRADVYRGDALIDVSLSLLESYGATFCTTASGLIKTRPIGTGRQK